MRDAPVTEDELNRTKDSLINSFVFSFESSSQIAFQQMMLDYRGFAPGFLETFTDNIAKVTVDDVQMVAQKYLHPDALTIVTVGNKENFDRPLDEFGDVNEIEIAQPEPPPVESIPEASETDVAKAKEILAAVVNAHGGWEVIKAVTSVVSQGQATFHMGGIQMSIKVSSLYPDKLRQDMVTPTRGPVCTIRWRICIHGIDNGESTIPSRNGCFIKRCYFQRCYSSSSAFNQQWHTFSIFWF